MIYFYCRSCVLEQYFIFGNLSIFCYFVKTGLKKVTKKSKIFVRLGIDFLKFFESLDVNAFGADRSFANVDETITFPPTFSDDIKYFRYLKSFQP